MCTYFGANISVCSGTGLLLVPAGTDGLSALADILPKTLCTHLCHVILMPHDSVTVCCVAWFPSELLPLMQVCTQDYTPVSFNGGKCMRYPRRMHAVPRELAVTCA